jgi:hypothetical protein
LTTILEEDKGEERNNALQLSNRLQSYVAEWTNEQLEQIAEYLLEWNTNARNSFLSQCLLQALVNTKGTAALMKIRSLKLQLQAFLAYSERHFQRIDKLHQASHVLEYMTTLMSVLPETTEDDRISLLKGKKDSWQETDANENTNAPLNIFDKCNGKGSVEVVDSDDSDSDVEDKGMGMNSAAEASFSGMVVDDSSSDEEEKEKVKSAKKASKNKPLTPKSTGKRKEKSSSTSKNSTPSTDKKKNRSDNEGKSTGKKARR